MANSPLVASLLTADPSKSLKFVDLHSRTKVLLVEAKAAVTILLTELRSFADVFPEKVKVEDYISRAMDTFRDGNWEDTWTILHTLPDSLEIWWDENPNASPEEIEWEARRYKAQDILRQIEFFLDVPHPEDRYDAAGSRNVTTPAHRTLVAVLLTGLGLTSGQAALLSVQTARLSWDTCEDGFMSLCGATFTTRNGQTVQAILAPAGYTGATIPTANWQGSPILWSIDGGPGVCTGSLMAATTGVPVLLAA